MIKANCDMIFYCRIFLKNITVFAVVFLFCEANVSAFNLDLKSSVSFSGPSNSYYGFTVAQYIDSKNQSTILIGAPKSADESNGPRYLGGAVYNCDINKLKKCSKIKFPVESAKDLREDRTEQWLGGTLTTDKSKGGIVVVCAPRYFWLSRENSTMSEPVGNCYYTKKGSLNLDETQTYHPCRQRTKVGINSYDELGSCQAGFSAAISKDPSRLYIGASGAYTWRGKVYAKNSVDPPRQNDTDKSYNSKDGEGYLGYSLTSLKFKSVNSSGIAAGIPRSHELSGQVDLFDSNLVFVKRLFGEQFASYFGYSMCTSDVDGDGAEDLIIGAPLHANYTSNKYDIGRIYIYYQGNGKCSKLDKACGNKTFNKFIYIDGEKPGARFGTAVTSLGDINQDGFDDIAVSAPYEIDVEYKSSGAIYVYLGSKNGLSRSPSQIIRPSDVNPLKGNSSLKSFGFSLFGGLDVDGNKYPDLAVGAYESDTVYLLNSRPVIHLKVTFRYLLEETNKRKFIVLEKINCKRKDNKKDALCVTLEICLKYEGQNTEQQIEISANITLDTKKATPRMRFEFNGSYTLGKYFSINKNENYCENMTIYVNNSDPFIDRLTPLVAQLEYDLVEPKIPKNLSSLLNVGSRIREDSMSIKKNCGEDDICEPDLNLNITWNLHGIRIPSNNEHLQLNVSVKNNGEDSYDSKFLLKVPRGLDYYNYNTQSAENTSVLYSLTSNNENIIFEIGNPLPGNQTVNFIIYLSTTESLSEVNDPELHFSASVNSTNPEKNKNRGNNQISFKIPVFEKFKIDIQTDTSHSNLNNISNYRFETVDKDVRAGPKAVHQYNIKNLGLSTISEMIAVFHWPDKLFKSEDLLYLVEQPIIEGNITCDPIPNVNYRNLTLKRNYTKVKDAESISNTILAPRTFADQKNTGKLSQKSPSNSQKDLLQPKSKVCSIGICFSSVRCQITNLSGNGEVIVAFPFVVWAKTLNKISRHVHETVMIGSQVEVHITKLRDNRAPKLNTTFSSEVFTIFESLKYTRPDIIPLWIVVGSPWLGIFILMMIIYGMYKCGFFERKRPPAMSGSYAQSVDDLAFEGEAEQAL